MVFSCLSVLFCLYLLLVPFLGMFVALLFLGFSWFDFPRNSFWYLLSEFNFFGCILGQLFKGFLRCRCFSKLSNFGGWSDCWPGSMVSMDVYMI